tara:strand:- start:3251 stop:3505 length:255 start_codon:yes stop_codon:yes gene_type:complete
MIISMTEYDLELQRIVEEIDKQKAKTVCLQLPEGLKPKASEIVDYINNKTDAEVMVWMGSCFGACDVPQLNVDLLIQFGHSEWI